MNLISGISSLLAIGILTPVQSIVSMIILFISTSISLYIQGFELISIIYILIYIGAIAILFLLIISLINIEFIPKKKNKEMSKLLMIILLIPIDLIINKETFIININKDVPIGTNNELIIVGNLIYTEYGIIMIIISLIILISIVGVISIIKI